jgi:RNA binding exosome subunit
MKKKIQDKIASWDSYELDGNLEDVIAKLQNLITVNPDHFEFNIEVESESGYYGSCSTNINITANRWESDEECEKRVAASKRASEAAKLAAQTKAENDQIRERQLYESLKKKFEKEIDETSALIKKQ